MAMLWNARAIELKKKIKDCVGQPTFPPPLTDIVYIIDYLTAHPQLCVRAERTLGKLAIQTEDIICSVSALFLTDALMRLIPNMVARVAESDFVPEMVKSLPRHVRDPSSKPDNIFKKIFARKEKTQSNPNGILLEEERTNWILAAIEDWTKYSEFPIFSETMLKMVNIGVRFLGDDKVSYVFLSAPREAIPIPIQYYDPKPNHPLPSEDFNEDQLSITRLETKGRGQDVSMSDSATISSNYTIANRPFDIKHTTPPPIGSFNYKPAISAHNLALLFRDILREGDIESIASKQNEFVLEMYRSCLREKKLLSKTLSEYSGGNSGFVQLLRAFEELKVMQKYYLDLQSGKCYRRSNSELDGEILDAFVAEKLGSVAELELIAKTRQPEKNPHPLKYELLSEKSLEFPPPEDVAPKSIFKGRSQGHPVSEGDAPVVQSSKAHRLLGANPSSASNLNGDDHLTNSRMPHQSNSGRTQNESNVYVQRQITSTFNPELFFTPSTYYGENSLYYDLDEGLSEEELFSQLKQLEGIDPTKAESNHPTHLRRSQDFSIGNQPVSDKPQDNMNHDNMDHDNMENNNSANVIYEDVCANQDECVVTGVGVIEHFSLPAGNLAGIIEEDTPHPTPKTSRFSATIATTIPAVVLAGEPVYSTEQVKTKSFSDNHHSSKLHHHVSVNDNDQSYDIDASIDCYPSESDGQVMDSEADHVMRTVPVSENYFHQTRPSPSKGVNNDLDGVASVALVSTIPPTYSDNLQSLSISRVSSNVSSGSNQSFHSAYSSPPLLVLSKSNSSVRPPPLPANLSQTSTNSTTTQNNSFSNGPPPIPPHLRMMSSSKD